MSFWVFVLTVAVAALVGWILRLRARLDELEAWSREVYAWIQSADRRRGEPRAEPAPRGDVQATHRAGAILDLGGAPEADTVSKPAVAAAPEPAPSNGSSKGAPPATPSAPRPMPPSPEPRHFVPRFGVAPEGSDPSAAVSGAADEPPIDSPPQPDSRLEAMARPESGFDWERLVGVRLFSWIAGVALALAAVFFLRYSIERGWLTPAIRFGLGIATGVALLVVAELRAARRYAVTANAATAAGVAILFASVFAGHDRWQLIGGGAAFLLLALVTAVAVVQAVRHDSHFIALLGLLGGFATPALLSTGEDRPISLFGYLLLLNIGLWWVAQRRRWAALTVLSFVLTTTYQIDWASKFLDGGKLPLAIAIFTTFSVAGFAALAARGDISKSDEQATTFELATFASALVPLGFALHLASVPAYGTRAGLLFGYLGCLALGLFAIALFRGRWPAHAAGGLAVGLVTATWIARSYEPAHWPGALFVVAAFAAFYLLSAHLAGWLKRPAEAGAALAPAVGAALVLNCALLAGSGQRTADPVLLIGVVLLLTALSAAVAISMRSRAVYAVAAVAAIATELAWAARIRGHSDEQLGSVLFVVCALLFLAVALVATRLERDGEEKEGAAIPPSALALAFSGHLLLLLLVLRSGEVPPPWTWLGAVLVLDAAIFAAGWRLRQVVQPVAAAGVSLWMLWLAIVELGIGPWPIAALSAAVGLWLPFLWRGFANAGATGERRSLEPQVSVVILGALVLLLGREAMRRAGWGDLLGLLPLAQALLLSPVVWRLYEATNEADLRARRETGRLALAAGAALGFIAVAIPMQLEKQWVTLSWALLAAALAGLHRRVPHRGLVLAATALGIAAFARLAANPAIFAYFPRQGPPILNWYLYTFLVSAAALYVAARFLRGERLGSGGFGPSRILAVAATILLFILLNIEIADFFSTGDRLDFGFLGSSTGLSEDLAYTIGWAMFAIALLAAGIAGAGRGARAASIALLVVTVLKAFLHDTWSLGGLYRVGSLVGLAGSLALVAMVLQKYVLRRGEPE